ncbi:chemotaxis protein CheA [Myxococcota bacterium]|nr:chemotaxis protein CheA [Myxococcota bacterium]MBU1381055.1 chemotaxis protein CheA [Myxococcota bacterium]MBU1499134.1 chemotaxis protein CheA [Myxococcota bacterium]
MNKKQFFEILEELETQLLLLDPADASAVSQTADFFREASTKLPKNTKKSISSNIQKALEIFEGWISDKELYSETSCKLDEIISTLKNEYSSVEKKEIQEDQKDERAFELPIWVDESTFRDFLSGTKQTLEEMEGLVLALENGDDDALGELKGLFHTMKGESGVLDMLNVQDVCHRIEDLILSDLEISTKVDVVLKTLDWLAGAFSAYANYSYPDNSGVISLIVNTMEDAQDTQECPDAEENDFNESDSGFQDSESTFYLTPPDENIPVKSKPSPRSSTEREIVIENSPTIEKESDISQGQVVEPRIQAAIQYTFDVIYPNWDEETVNMLAEFLNEGGEGLTRVDEILINIESEGIDAEKVNDIFRAYHTIKGVAGFLELKAIEKLAHSTESLLNQVRKGEMQFEGGLIDLVFDSTEIMRIMMDDIRSAIEKGIPVSTPDGLSVLLNNLDAALSGQIPLPIHLKADPGDFIGEILVKNEIIDEQTVEGALKEAEIKNLRLGEQLLEEKAVKPADIGHALRTQRITRSNLTAVKDPEDEENIEQREPPQAFTSNKPAQTKTCSDDDSDNAPRTDAKGAKLKETVKIDLEKVDNLVEMIGELVIVESMVVSAPEIEKIVSINLRKNINQLNKITRDLQNVSMMMRMVPVKGLFQKMARMVRDLSRKSGKNITMTQNGETTEIDRHIVESLGDPLVHMIRNSVDHGIEPEADRLRAGKPAAGNVTLNAFQEGGKIIIEIIDDGRGLNREAILKKALKQGIIAESDKPSDAEIYNLIFAPGFSTAEKVTEISGRGVGMDVVRRNIESLQGKVLIETNPGRGTKFRIVLPLTTAIIDGMIVTCGDSRYIIPTLSIISSLQPNPALLSTLADNVEFIDFFGSILPLLRLSRMFGIEDAINDPTKGLVVILETYGQRIGLLVDDIVKQQQVVIKPVDVGTKKVELFSGAAILSDGRVGLILNIEQIAMYAKSGYYNKNKLKSEKEMPKQ